MSDVLCGPQKPGEVAGPFDWGVLAAIVAAGGVFAGALATPVSTALVGLITAIAGTGPATTAGLGAPLAGVLAIWALVGYYLLQPDGCLVPNEGEKACASGVVDEVVDLSSTAVYVLAPFAVTAAGAFYLVVRTEHLHLVTKDAGFVYCNARPAPLLVCLVRDAFSCGARIGATVGAIAGGVGGLVLGFLAGAAIASLACGPFAWLCFILALIVAAIVAVVVTYAGAMVGGWVGGAIGEAVGSDPEDQFDSLQAGDTVTARGFWNTNPDIGNNEFYYTTQIDLMGHVDAPPHYVVADADANAPNNCPTDFEPPR